MVGGVTLCLLFTGALVAVTEAASSPAFACDGVDACNHGKDDQYCSDETHPKCVNCHTEDNRCFTKEMAPNCTTHCRELDNKEFLEKARTKPCPALRNVIKVFNNASESPQPGEIVQFTCNSGYRVEGYPVIKCLEYGIWSLSQEDLPLCKEIVCMAPALDHGKVTTTSQMTTVGSIVTYECDQGYTPSDPHAQALCQPNGTWKSLACDKVQIMQAASEKDTVWMISAIVASVLCVILIFALISMCLWKKKYCRYTPVSDGSETCKNGSPKADAKEPSLLKEVVSAPNCSSTKENKKPISTLSPPRKTNKESTSLDIDPEYPMSPNKACSFDDSLPPSTASSTNPKNVSGLTLEAPREPSAPPQSTIHKENGLPSKESDTSPESSYIMGKNNGHIHLNVHVNNSGNNNYNTNNNNNDNGNICSHPSNRSNNSHTIPENKETKKRETNTVPNNTHYPTQASGSNDEDSDSQISTYASAVGTMGGYDADSDSLDSATAAGGNSDVVDNNFSTTGRHAQPIDESKPGKLVLRDNTVHMNDVNGKRESAKAAE